MNDPQQMLYRYTHDETLTPVTESLDRAFIADSFLVNHGMARSPELHATRFSASCQTFSSIPAKKLSRFWQLAMQQIPTEGMWFPRIEMLGPQENPTLQIRIRPAPKLQTEARLIHCRMPDSRIHPRHKGPDISLLNEQRQHVMAMGADEGFLCTPKQYLLEGLFSSILWWEGDTLCQTPSSKRVLPSITATLLREVAAKRHTPFARRFRRWHELDGCETWIVNALHGIRRVLNWPLASWRTKNHADRNDWQLALNHYALRPVCTQPAA